MINVENGNIIMKYNILLINKGQLSSNIITIFMQILFFFRLKIYYFWLN